MNQTDRLAKTLTVMELVALDKATPEPPNMDECETGGDEMYAYGEWLQRMNEAHDSLLAQREGNIYDDMEIV